jgi:hypothetical protein
LSQRKAINFFLHKFYTDEPLETFVHEDYLLIILKLVDKKYKKLTDAHYVYEIISTRMKSLINDPKQLVDFLVQHLKPKELEKKENGEVFTPPELIEEQLDRLTSAYPTIWSNPHFKFFDPANGIGNYPALAYRRLMEGLIHVIPDDEERKKHILEKQLYMCEINPKNIEVSRMLFNPEGHFNLNLFEGSFLELNPKKEWGVDRFDVVFGNPPFQPPSNGKKGGNSLWPDFVRKGLDLLMDDGYLVFVHPAIWRKPDDGLHELMFSKQLYYLSIHTDQEGNKMFRSNTRYDWYVLQKKLPCQPTRVRLDDNTTLLMMITPTLPYIPNHGNSIMEKMCNRTEHGFLTAHVSYEGDSRKKYVSKHRTSDHTYPLINSISKKNGICLWWSSQPLTYQFKKKVIFSNGRYISPLYDDGKFGTTQGGIYILVDTDEEGIQLARFLNSRLVSYIVRATKWSNYATDKKIFSCISNPKSLPYNFTDAHVYEYYGLTSNEIERIEASEVGKGLDKYAPPAILRTPLPLVQREAQAIETFQVLSNDVDTRLMNVINLKKMCKERKIKGYSRLKKHELINMLQSPR